jgi:Flp pilus assembly protein TadG
MKRSRPRAFSRLRSQAGQSLVELALLTPLLLVLLIAIVEMGRYSYLSIVLGNAARAGASYGAQGLAYCVNTSGIQTAADNDFQNNGQSTGNLTVTSAVTCGCDGDNGTVSPDTSAECSASSAGTCSSGHWVVTVHVTAQAKFNSLFSYPGIPKSITVSSTAVMRVKQD